jgi:hypothetical protein
MLWWSYLQSVVTLLGAQFSVVFKERLYSRGLVDGPTTEPDYRAYEAYAKHEDPPVSAASIRSGDPGDLPGCGAASARGWLCQIRCPPRRANGVPLVRYDGCGGALRFVYPLICQFVDLPVRAQSRR